jgi:hypothetical protein
MGQPGPALDNAAIESWHSTLEFELRRLEHYATRAQARAGVALHPRLQPTPAQRRTTRRSPAHTGLLLAAGYGFLIRQHRTAGRNGVPDPVVLRVPAPKARSNAPAPTPSNPMTIRSRWPNGFACVGRTGRCATGCRPQCEAASPR